MTARVCLLFPPIEALSPSLQAGLVWATKDIVAGEKIVISRPPSRSLAPPSLDNPTLDKTAGDKQTTTSVIRITCLAEGSSTALGALPPAQTMQRSFDVLPTLDLLDPINMPAMRLQS